MMNLDDRYLIFHVTNTIVTVMYNLELFTSDNLFQWEHNFNASQICLVLSCRPP